MAECDGSLLDDYLAGTLCESARVQFGRHLEVCDHCRSEVELQRRIDACLVEGCGTVALPPTLIDDVRREVDRKVRHRRHCQALAISAALLLAAGAAWIGRQVWRPAVSVTVGSTAEHVTGDEPTSLTVQTHDTGVTARERPVHVAISAPDIIAASFKTDDPTVTIVMLYPAYKPDTTDQ